MRIKAIPTEYRGTVYRSTLEADWAATLDRYRIEYQYEPEGLELPSGEFYRPDFWLPRIRTYLEVKGLHGERVHKAEELRWAVCCEDECQCRRAWRSQPWRMVVVGGPAADDGCFHAMVPGVSTAFALCPSCKAWQWSTRFSDIECRVCGNLDDVDGWASVQHSHDARGDCVFAYGLVRQRASLLAPRR